MSADEAEAHRMLAQQVARVEAMSHDELAAMLPRPRWSIRLGWLAISRGEDHMIHEEVVSPSGETYQVQIQAAWEDEDGGTIRVFLAVDGGAIPPTHPLGECVLVPRPGAAD